MYLLADQIGQLGSLGNVKFYEDYPGSIDEWLSRCSTADIICTDKNFISENVLQKLHNVLIIIPYRSSLNVDKNLMRSNNIEIRSFSREYKESVSEWIVGMIFYFYRELHTLVRVRDEENIEILKLRKSLMGRNITILGQGAIGNRVSEICLALGLNVKFFKRNENVKEKVMDADIIVNCLRKNDRTVGLINKDVFCAFKKGSFFISVTPLEIYDFEAMIYALDNGILLAVAEDASGKSIGNLNDKNYQKLLSHPNILVTPHIAWMTDYEARKTYDKMLKIIKNWIRKKANNE